MRTLYDPQSTEPFRLSRSKLELFLHCPRCFYLDRRCGVARPDGPPFSLNLAVDALLKKEFDARRLHGEAHPLMTMYGVDAIPFRHQDIDRWRDPLRGIAYVHGPTCFAFFGAVDDVWVNPRGEIVVVDYKATSTDYAITLDGDWKDAYKRQVEMYQWLFRHNGFAVSPMAYFVYANAQKDREAFDRKLDFAMHILPYEGDDAWVDDALLAAHDCLNADRVPPYAEKCEWCAYRREAKKSE